MFHQEIEYSDPEIVKFEAELRKPHTIEELATLMMIFHEKVDSADRLKKEQVSCVQILASEKDKRKIEKTLAKMHKVNEKLQEYINDPSYKRAVKLVELIEVKLDKLVKEEAAIVQKKSEPQSSTQQSEESAIHYKNRL